MKGFLRLRTAGNTPSKVIYGHPLREIVSLPDGVDIPYQGGRTLNLLLVPRDKTIQHVIAQLLTFLDALSNKTLLRADYLTLDNQTGVGPAHIVVTALLLVAGLLMLEKFAEGENLLAVFIDAPDFKVAVQYLYRFWEGGSLHFL